MNKWNALSHHRIISYHIHWGHNTVGLLFSEHHGHLWAGWYKIIPYLYDVPNWVGRRLQPVWNLPSSFSAFCLPPLLQSMIDPPGKLIRRWNEHTGSSLSPALRLFLSVSLSVSHKHSNPHPPTHSPNTTSSPPPNLIFAVGAEDDVYLTPIWSHTGWIEPKRCKKLKFFWLERDHSEELSQPCEHHALAGQSYTTQHLPVSQPKAWNPHTVIYAEHLAAFINVTSQILRHGWTQSLESKK